MWGFLITTVASKSDDIAVFLVSRLCASFQLDTQMNLLPAVSWTEGEESEEEEDSDNSGGDCGFDDCFEDDIWMRSYEDGEDFEDDGVADSDEDSGGDGDGFEVDICKDDSFNWRLYSEIKTREDTTVNDFLTGICNLIADCGDGRNELKDYQKKMIRTLVRCFAVFKVYVHSYSSPNILVLCEYLKENFALTELLWYRNFDELALGTIGHVLQTSQRLVGLHLRTDLNSTSLTPALQSNRTLTHLNLQYARVRISGAKALGEVLESNRTLTHINLHANRILHIGAEALAKGLQSNNVLKHLDLSCNWIGDRGAVALAHVLESNHTLTYLDAGNYAETMEGIPDFFRPSSDFDDVRSEYIGESGALAIAHALQSNCSLTYLDLQGNNVNDSAAAALGRALQSNYTLTHFYLRSMLIPTKVHFGNSGAVAFAKALQSSGTQLTRLDLRNTSINSSVAIALAEGLKSNHSLERLDLSGNKIEFSGAVALAKALKSNRALTHLQLHLNHIGDSGATEFAKTLPYNDTLTFLDLRWNRIGKLGILNLQQINPRTSCTVKWA